MHKKEPLSVSSFLQTHGWSMTANSASPLSAPCPWPVGFPKLEEKTQDDSAFKSTGVAALLSSACCPRELWREAIFFLIWGLGVSRLRVSFSGAKKTSSSVLKTRSNLMSWTQKGTENLQEFSFPLSVLSSSFPSGLPILGKKCKKKCFYLHHGWNLPECVWFAHCLHQLTSVLTSR